MHRRNFQKSSFLFALTAALLLIGITVIMAQETGQIDGRINKNAHFGGDALYCTQAEMPSSDTNGFRLLNNRGEVLWEVSASDVRSAQNQVRSGEPPILIADGIGTYGSVALYTGLDARSSYFFLFTGYDEHGKANSLVFDNCTPVNTREKGSNNFIGAPTSTIGSTPTAELATPSVAPPATDTPSGPTATSTVVCGGAESCS